MLDLITIGNISADLYFNADELTTLNKRFYLAQGGKYFVDDFYFSIGGGAANVAIGAKKNRLKTAVCAVVGNNVFRKYILQSLVLKGIPRRFLLFKQSYSCVSMILLKNGERTIVNYETPHEHLDEDKLISKKISKARSVYIGNMPEVSLGERKKLLKRLKKNGVLIVGNIGKKDCCRPKKTMKEYIENMDILILNTHEFSELVRKPYKKINFRADATRHLSILRSKILILTDAEKGSYGYEKGKVYFQKAIVPKKLVDATGAGDGYTAGFISEYLKSEDVEKAMNKGARYATRIISHIGAN